MQQLSNTHPIQLLTQSCLLSMKKVLLLALCFCMGTSAMQQEQTEPNYDGLGALFGDGASVDEIKEKKETFDCNGNIILPASARALSKVLSQARATTHFWVPALWFALHKCYGQTQAYTMGNILLNTANVVCDMGQGCYNSMPAFMLDSLHQLGCLSQVEQTIESNMGLSMTGISNSSFYNITWAALFLKTIIRPSVISKISCSLYDIPAFFNNSLISTKIGRDIFRPFFRLKICKSGIDSVLEYMQAQTQQLADSLSASNQVIDQNNPG